VSRCPTPETLGQLACDSSCGSQFATIEAHVQTCAHCQQVLERIAVDGSVSEGRCSARLAEPEHTPTIPGFVIEGVIGRGGMGVVYQAWQPHLARRVAIKVVSASIGIGAEDRRRWLREAQAIGRVRHRNVVQVHEAGEQDGCLYLVLDLIAGGSLADRVSGPLSARVAVEVMATVARAVDHIHRAEILHLDIKPSNILLDGLPDAPWDQVAPMIADFGIARTGDDSGATATGPAGLRGTPSFMAPEQIAGDRVTIGPRSDVFALGATLYSLLTGRPPFQGASVIETLDLVRTREPASPKALIPDLPHDLETIALTCLNKDPRRRYASASALADDMQRWLDGFPIRARPVSKLEHACRWCRRRPAVAALLAFLALTVASSLVGLLALWRHSEAERGRAENALTRALESDRATSDAVRDLVGVLATTVEAPQVHALERFQKSSHAVRELTAKLRKNRRFATSNLVAICGLERQLAEAFLRRGKYAESRALLTDSLELLEERKQGADDPDVAEAYASALALLGYIAFQQERYDEVIACVNRAGEVLESLAPDPRHLEVIDWIDFSRRLIASWFARTGQEEPRRRLMESQLSLLERLSARAGGDPAIDLFGALVRMDLAPDDIARIKLRVAIQRCPAGGRLARLLRDRLAYWIADDVSRRPSDPKTRGESKTRLEPETDAQAVIHVIESRCKALGVYPGLLPSTAFEVAGIGVYRSVEQRAAGRLDDARQTAAWLLDFGKTLERRNPDEAAFQLILSLAFEQEAENARKVEEYATTEAALSQAIRKASAAYRLDPENTYTRLRIANLQDKLFGVVSERPSPR
jgi:eukaryotic-like serine/threonine-protein kinase